MGWSSPKIQQCRQGKKNDGYFDWTEQYLNFYRQMEDEDEISDGNYQTRVEPRTTSRDYVISNCVLKWKKKHTMYSV